MVVGLLPARRNNQVLPAVRLHYWCSGLSPWTTALIWSANKLECTNTAWRDHVMQELIWRLHQLYQPCFQEEISNSSQDEHLHFFPHLYQVLQPPDTCLCLALTQGQCQSAVLERWSGRRGAKVLNFCSVPRIFHSHSCLEFCRHHSAKTSDEKYFTPNWSIQERVRISLVNCTIIQGLTSISELPCLYWESPRQ